MQERVQEMGEGVGVVSGGIRARKWGWGSRSPNVPGPAAPLRPMRCVSGVIPGGRSSGSVAHTALFPLPRLLRTAFSAPALMADKKIVVVFGATGKQSPGGRP